MNATNISFPASLHAAAGELATASGFTIDQFVASAVAEKMSILAGPGWLAERAARGNRVAFDAAMAKVPDVEPEEFDRIPSQS